MPWQRPTRWQRSERLQRSIDHLGEPLVSREELGESPFWPTAAVVTAAGLYVTLPTTFIAGGSSAGIFGAARWVVAGLVALLLILLVLTTPRFRVIQRATSEAAKLRLTRRVASIAVIALISLANATSIVLLVHYLVAGAQTNARLLLRAGIHLWCMNVLVFGLWFWQLDGGGPVERRIHPPRRGRDFLFPQQTFEEDAYGRWQPIFVDYLYLAYTNATAFSPTDAMPLSRWSKVLMMVESAASLLLAIMVVARAVNILR
jgi:hypothetical protein